MTEIVVGVDGSPSSERALRWALQEAHRRGARVRVLHAWSFPFTQGEIAHLAGEALHQPLERDAQRILDTAIREAGDAAEGVDIERTVTEGPPAAALLQAARDAELLVVGSRGHGGFAGLLLGSVSQQCAQHAPCPVVIVRD